VGEEVAGLHDVLEDLDMPERARAAAVGEARDDGDLGPDGEAVEDESGEGRRTLGRCEVAGDDLVQEDLNGATSRMIRLCSSPLSIN
jgi:hypothetical protein